MKARILSVLLLVVFSVSSYGVVAEEQLTPQNITKQAFKFTIVPRTDNLGMFKITVEAKERSQVLPKITPLLSLQNGKKWIARVRPETVKIANGIEVLAFYVSPDYLAESTLQFGIGTDTSYWFYLKDFVAP